MNAALDDQLAYTIRNAAKRVDLSHDELERAIKAGELPAKRRGRRVLIQTPDLKRWLAGLEDY